MELLQKFKQIALVVEKQRRINIASLALLLFVIIGTIDVAINANISLSFFYLIPIAFATWFVGRHCGIVIAILSAFTRIEEQIGSAFLRDHHDIIGWNIFLHLSFMLRFVWLFSLLRAHLKTEQALSRTDEVTGIPNRRAFMEKLRYVLDLETRSEHPVTLAYIDLDNFKQINDSRGHDEGDRVLQLVAVILMQSIRRSDIAARLGGDEFALLIPGANRVKAEFLIAKLRASLTDRLVTHQPRITCSIGCVTFISPPSDPDDAIRAADFLMYQIKRRGKNEVAFADF